MAAPKPKKSIRRFLRWSQIQETSKPTPSSAPRWRFTDSSAQAFWRPFISRRLRSNSRPEPFRLCSEAELPVYYKGERLTCSYRADFVCYDEVIVELKALKAITGVEEAQVLNYLKATGLGRGLLLNFGCPRLEFKRLVFSHLRTSAESADATRP